LVLNFLLSLPFSLYSTFVIEQRFGFNTTSVATYITDRIKAALLVIVLGGPLLAAIYWFFAAAGSYGWLYCWLAVFLFSLIVQFLAPVLILPLFNTFSPLADGPLRTRIMEYADQQRFHVQGIFTMDGSKRSTKLNAFFTGFGRFRKIVFYDTLMEKLSDDEIIAVLAHEMGHCKLGHVVKMTVASALQSGLMFYLLSLTLDNRLLFDAFAMEHLSVYASLVFFGILYTPVNIVVSIAFHALSRKHEYQADRYAILSTGEGLSLISGLKKLCQANLANLTPHPLAVVLEYTHPPILQRIEAIRHLHQ
jgi:STE24 endopeptidase